MEDPLDIRLYGEVPFGDPQDNEAIRFCKVTYEDTSGNIIAEDYVRSGTEFTVQDPGSNMWTDGTTQYSKDSKLTITKSITLTAVSQEFTVTYVDEKGNTTSSTHKPTETHTVKAPPTGYRWSDANGKIYEGGESIKTTTTLTANICRVTIDGKEQWDKAGDTITLPEGYTWSDGSKTYDGAETVTITKPVNFSGTIKTYTITYYDEDGTAVLQTFDPVPYGATHTVFADLPDGCTLWSGSDGKSYSPNASLTVKADLELTAARKSYTVQYVVNFPTVTNNFSYDSRGTFDLNSYTVPTVTSGGQTGTSVTHSFAGNALTVSPVSESIVVVKNNHSGKYYNGYPIQFAGWDVDGNGMVDIRPGTVLTAAQIEEYAQNDTITFTGVWTHSTVQTVNFFLLYTSDVDEMTSGSESDYTKSVFTTVMNGEDHDNLPETILATTDAEAYTIDKTVIRPMYGPGEGKTRWLAGFPKDEDVFRYLIENQDQYQGTIKVEGEEINIADLNTDQYVIRWCKVQLYSGSDKTGWHIDGKIVKKQGRIIVDKSFAGDADAVAAAKNGFYILAENGTKDANGNFTPYVYGSDANFKQYILTLDEATGTALKAIYPNAAFQTAASGGAADNYEWLIANVTLGEYWRITEYPTGVDGASYYAEYSVYDTDGNTTAVAEYGTRAAVVGKTFALDEDPDQGLLVDFRNYYYPTGSILIKKEDAKTGKPIGNAVFELYQKGNQLTFDYNSETGQYVRNEAGTGAISQITTAADGFSIISTTGFSYKYGNVVVKEVTAPPGYDPAPNITLGWNSETEKNVVLRDLSYPNGDVVDSGKWADHAEVPNNDVLVVKDGTSYYADVTVTKEWDPVDMAQESVVVALQVNGTRATSIFPGLANVEVTLSADNHWTYTWEDLPAYANGELAEWGVKEIKVGGDPTLADGETFANWIAVTALRQKTDSDANGIVDTWDYLVTNTPRRTMIVLNKVDHLGNALAGAAFTLVEAAYSGVAWQPISGAVALSAVTDANGILKFDALTAGKTYLLTEVQAPEGYVMTLPPTALRVDGDGVIKQVNADGSAGDLDSASIKYVKAYNIQVTNISAKPLPETGGQGTGIYTRCGALLMAAALALLVYKKRDRREVDLPDG